MLVGRDGHRFFHPTKILRTNENFENELFFFEKGCRNGSFREMEKLSFFKNERKKQKLTIERFCSF